jgi:integrase
MGYEKTSVPGIYRRGETFSVAFRHPITRKTTFRTAGKTLREAKALKRQLEEERDRGLSSPDGQLTFGELWSIYEEQHIPTLAPSTQADYRSAGKRLLAAYRLAKVNSIDTAEVLRYREELLRTKSSTTGRTLSAKRVRNLLLVLGSVYSFAVATNRARSNPVQGMRRAGRSQEPEERAVFLTQEEVGELLRSIRRVNPSYHCLFLLLAQTGMRLSEALALETSSIDLVKRRISITRSVYRGVSKAPKNGRGRVVGISDALHEVLAEHLQGKEGGLAFPSRSGGYISPDGLRRYVFDRAVEQSDLPQEKKERLKIHSLRHSAASHLMNSGTVSPLAVMELFGWSSLSMVLRYSHADVDQAAEAGAAAVGDLH